jgi:hypothetical protein
MSAIPYDSQTPAADIPEQDGFVTPGRRRRRFLNRKSAALAALLTCAAGFYAGVSIEKSQLNSAPTTATAGLPAGAAAGGGAQGAAGTGSGAARAGFFGGAARGGGNASVGTVSSVDGNTVYLTDSSGNTVKVTLSSATKITKSETVSATSVRPGDAVVIQGLKSTNGTIAATSVSDSGAGATRGPGGAGSGATPTTTGTAG